MPYEYVKLHRSFFTGTMHSEAAYTKLLFLAMLIECTDGTVTATADHLCRFTNLKPEAVERGLEALQQPDPNSTSLELDGRRIVAVAGMRNTYRIVNWGRYQPALSSDWKEKPGLSVVDPQTGEKVDRLLPDGSKNPRYQMLYQRAYRRWVKERDQAAAALEAEVKTIGVNTVNSKPVYEPAQNPANEDPGRVNSLSKESPEVEPEQMEDSVKIVNSVNKRKEKESKENKSIPPKPPKNPPGSSKAVYSGNPENDESFERFRSLYPIPSNGRRLKPSEARITWDLLAKKGVDLEVVIKGVERYRNYVEERQGHEYVAAMPVWLNGKQWEEPWYIHPESEEGKKIKARKEAEKNERKAAFVATYREDYEKFIDGLVEKGSQDPTWLQGWRQTIEKRLAGRRAVGMSGKGIEALENLLNDPEAGRESQKAMWKEENLQTMPRFWAWSREHNKNHQEF